MRKTVIASVALLGFFAARAEAQYNPFGPQQNVSLSTIITGGWTQCYQAFMSVPIGNDAEEVLTPCQGENIMMAGRATGSDTFILLAAGNRAAVTFDVGNGADAHHAVNGSEWYFSPGFSWGFAPLNATTDRNQCDIMGSAWEPGPYGDQRMCLHTFDVGGWRIGENIELNGSNDFEKVFFVNNGLVAPVPEPASLTLLATGLVGLFGVARRRKASSAS